MGYCPEWYSHIRAAKYLNVAPWELLERPSVWTSWANMAQDAEFESQKQKQAAAEARQKAEASMMGGG